MRSLRTISALLLILVNGVALAGEDAVLGSWLTDGGKSRVEISHCGEALCGKISWLKEPVYPEDDEMAGQQKVDRENPDQALRSRPLEGLKLLSGFHYDKDNVWTGGRIYDPRNGKTYSCKMTLVDDHTLKVRGYIGFSLFGRTVIWTR
jgi:uncharacterized protein (DUF2147 family)